MTIVNAHRRQAPRPINDIMFGHGTYGANYIIRYDKDNVRWAMFPCNRYGEIKSDAKGVGLNPSDMDELAELLKELANQLRGEA